jgi:hypothetical protein
MQSVITPKPSGQVALEGVVRDLRVIRQRSFSTNPRSRTGIVAGQLLLLLRELQGGKRPSRRSLRGFVRFVARDIERRGLAA